jgi:hypothetical protein
VTQNTTNYDNTKLSTVQGTNINNPNFVRISDGNVSPAVSTQGDNDVSLNMLGTNSRGQLFNGSFWDRKRGNIETLNVLISAARTTGTACSLQTLYNGRGIFIVLKVTVASGTGGLKVIARDKNAIWLNGQAGNITAVGTYGFMLYPGITTSDSATPSAANVVWRTSQSLPRFFDILVSPSDSSSYTYSLDYYTIL